MLDSGTTSSLQEKLFFAVEVLLCVSVIVSSGSGLTASL